MLKKSIIEVSSMHSRAVLRALNRSRKRSNWKSQPKLGKSKNTDLACCCRAILFSIRTPLSLINPSVVIVYLPIA